MVFLSTYPRHPTTIWWNSVSRPFFVNTFTRSSYLVILILIVILILSYSYTLLYFVSLLLFLFYVQYLKYSFHKKMICFLLGLDVVFNNDKNIYLFNFEYKQIVINFYIVHKVRIYPRRQVHCFN